MKNIFIAGVARSGKSTIAKRLHNEFNYNHIPLDYFASSFKHNFKEAGINSNPLMESSEKLALFILRVVNIIDFTDELFIIDSAHIKPNDIIKYLDRNKWEIIYVGYPDISKEEKLNQVRRFDSKDDWTFKKSDDELLKTLNDLIILSKEIEEMCKEYNIKFINTSYNFNKVLDKEYNNIKGIII